MSDTNAQFHFALARVSAIQLLRSTGIDRARPSVIESLADIMVQYIQLLGIKSKEAAESAGRHACELEDAREALERVGSVRVTTRQNAREEEGVVQFITWCMSDEATHMRRIAGEGQDEMGEEVTADWLNHLIQKQIKVTGEDKFSESVLSPTLKLDDNTAQQIPNNGSKGPRLSIDGLQAVADALVVPEVVRDHNGR